MRHVRVSFLPALRGEILLRLACFCALHAKICSLNWANDFLLSPNEAWVNLTPQLAVDPVSAVRPSSSACDLTVDQAADCSFIAPYSEASRIAVKHGKCFCRI